MKVIETKYKRVEQPVESYLVEFTPDELKYIKILALCMVNKQAYTEHSLDINVLSAASRLFNKLAFTANINPCLYDCFKD